MELSYTIYRKSNEPRVGITFSATPSLSIGEVYALIDQLSAIASRMRNPDRYTLPDTGNLTI